VDFGKAVFYIGNTIFNIFHLHGFCFEAGSLPESKTITKITVRLWTADSEGMT
jgi:hypothetical protein